MNSVTLIGRLTKDAEVSYTSTSTALAKFTLAVDKPKKDGEQTADFIRITAWGKTAEIVDKYTSKGSQIAIVGRIQTGSYDNRNGDKVYTTDIIADKVELLGSKSDKVAPFQTIGETIPF